MKMKTPSVGNRSDFPSHHILQFELLTTLSVPLISVITEFQMKLIFGFCLGAPLQDGAGPQGIPPVDDRHRRGIAGQEQAFFQGRVTAAHHHHFLILEEPAVACGAVRYPPPGQLLLTRHIQVIGAGPGRDDQGFRQVFAARRSSPGNGRCDRSTAVASSYSTTAPKRSACFWNNSPKLRPTHAIWKARVILNRKCQGGLPAQLHSGQYHRVQLGPGRI